MWLSLKIIFQPQYRKKKGILTIEFYDIPILCFFKLLSYKTINSIYKMVFLSMPVLMYTRQANHKTN